MRLLPRFGRINSKREVWPGGPQIGEVIEAQLTPPANAAVADADADAGEDETARERQHTTATQLLLLLR